MLPLLYLPSDPSVVQIGRRGDSKQVLLDHELGPDNHVIALALWYGFLMSLSLWFGSLGLRKYHGKAPVPVP